MVSERILVVEDAHYLRRDLVEMIHLHFEDFEVIEAENGQIGIEKAKLFLPNLIICDIMMPVMTGDVMLQELRRDKRTANIPLIFVTARADPSDLRTGMVLGADDYITKPFTAAELVDAVRTRLQREGDRINALEERMNDLRENIITAMPHEFRTPLNVVLGFSNLLALDKQIVAEPNRVEEMAQHINDGANRLYRLVENYITYANTELLLSDRNRREIFKPGFMVMPKSSIESHARERARMYGREDDLIFDLVDTSVLPIHDEYFKKIIDEVVDNACKFSNPPAFPPGLPIEIRTMVEGGRYLIAIRDEGRGMKREYLSRIGAFMQFERRAYEQQGSGLGLIIAKRLTELHGGEFSITSQLEHGTVVTIELPIGNLPDDLPSYSILH
jgi:signal transduction histidine kinase